MGYVPATYVIGKGLYDIYQGNQDSHAANNAVSAQQRAAEQANAQAQATYEQQRADQEPWRVAGGKALGQLESGNVLPDFQGDPGYQFRIDQGKKALNAAASARGGATGGAQMMALTRYGQDYASNEYNNAYNRQSNRLMAIAGLGQNANNATTQAAGQYSTNYSNNVSGSANAQAAGAAANSNISNNVNNNMFNTLASYNMLNRMFPKTEPVSNASYTNPAQGPWVGNNYFNSNGTQKYTDYNFGQNSTTGYHL